MTPFEVGLDVSASVNAEFGEWQLPQDWPGGFDNCVSKKSWLPKSSIGVSDESASLGTPKMIMQQKKNRLNLFALMA